MGEMGMGDENLQRETAPTLLMRIGQPTVAIRPHKLGHPAHLSAHVK
jgi:hypothetical protein